MSKSNNRVCFISMTNLYLCPYLQRYVSLINCGYDIIYWNRHSIEESSHDRNANLIPFNYSMNETSTRSQKAVGYIRFSCFLWKILCRKKYKTVVFLHAVAGTILTPVLLFKYRHKFIIDVRDFSYDHNVIYAGIQALLFRYALKVVISSKKYTEFLPKRDYLLVHNSISISDDIRSKFKLKEISKTKIRISYIGLIRFYDELYKFIDAFKNDNRFELNFIGKGANELTQYCTNNNVTNVKLIDVFPPDQTLEHYMNCDIIFNAYGNGTPLLNYALSNKLYYSAMLYIPIIVTPKTYMAEIVKENELGFEISYSGQTADCLYNRFLSFDRNSFIKRCDQFIKSIETDNSAFDSIISKLFEERS